MFFVLVSLSLLQGLAGENCFAGDQQVVGRYKVSGATIRHTITIPPQPPMAVIVVQYLPPGTEIIAAEPAFSRYDQEKGEVKWLFKDVNPGPLTIDLKLGHEVDRNQLRAEALFKDGQGGSNTYTLAPQPMMRKAIEGC